MMPVTATTISISIKVKLRPLRDIGISSVRSIVERFLLAFMASHFKKRCIIASNLARPAYGMTIHFPVADAHHHFWDPQRNYHPWLRDEPPVPFRYGDYSALKRRYLPADYFADAGYPRTRLLPGCR